MIRFVDMRSAEIAGARFAFWNTVYDNWFATSDGDVAWSCLCDWRECLKAHTTPMTPDQVARFECKLPDWAQYCDECQPHRPQMPDKGINPDTLRDVHPMLEEAIDFAREHNKGMDGDGEAHPDCSEDYNAKMADYAGDRLLAWVGIADGHPWYTKGS